MSSTFPKKRRSRRGKGGKKTTAAVAASALRQVKELKRDREMKVSTSTGAIEPHTLGDVGFNPTNIPQGDGQTSRDGDKITPKSLYLTGYLTMNTAQSTNTSTEVDILIVQDKQQVSDTTPTYADIIDGGPGQVLFMNNNTLGRYRILSHKQYVLAANVRLGIRVKTFIKLSGSVRYNSTTSTDIQKNGIYVIMRSNQSLIEDPPLFTGGTRLRYTDM